MKFSVVNHIIADDIARQVKIDIQNHVAAILAPLQTEMNAENGSIKIEMFPHNASVLPVGFSEGLSAKIEALLEASKGG